jgi:hypothetical protein
MFMGYLVFEICNWKGGGGGVDIWFFSKQTLIFNCSFTFSNKISYMYIWDIHVLIKISNSYVYDGDRNIMCIFSCWSSFLGFVPPVPQKCIFPSNCRCTPSRACEMHVSEPVCPKQYEGVGKFMHLFYGIVCFWCMLHCTLYSAVVPV